MLINVQQGHTLQQKYIRNLLNIFYLGSSLKGQNHSHPQKSEDFCEKIFFSIRINKNKKFRKTTYNTFYSCVLSIKVMKQISAIYVIFWLEQYIREIRFGSIHCSFPMLKIRDSFNHRVLFETKVSHADIRNVQCLDL